MSSSIRFHFQSTRDGSPTLRFDDGKPRLSEAMHSTQGAYSETRYVYGNVIEWLLQSGLEPRFLSVGLGLGYVEMCIAVASLKCKIPQPIYLESYESEAELRDYFQLWLQGENLPPEAHGFAQAYSWILTRSCADAKLEPKYVKEWLAMLLREGAWQIKERFPPAVASGKFTAILFDAFSAHTSPDLWTPETLLTVANTFAAPQCVFSTYAATGHLKRALRNANFHLYRRNGFAGKRESCVATRGIAPLDFTVPLLDPVVEVDPWAEMESQALVDPTTT